MMEKIEKKNKKEQIKEKKKNRKLDLTFITGNLKKELAYDDDALTSLREVFGVVISGTDSDSTGSSGYGGLGSPGLMGPLQAQRQGQVQQWRTMIDMLRFKSVRRLSTIPLLTASYESSRRNIWNKLVRIRPANEEDFLDVTIDIDGIPTKPSWRNFSYNALAAATDDFNPENLIGKGGHAEVYKGCLADGQVVAIKRLMRDEKGDDDTAGSAGDFLSELGIIAHINHPNATRLIGFGIDRGLFLVLQMAPHGSLASFLFGSQCLKWKKRFNVAVGVAKGLQYLHHDCPRRIIHRDIKALNILLNHKDEAEISDFGLAKWLPDKWTNHVVFPIEGTFGYLAPEYFLQGIVDEKTDVFAFGVLLLELITGRRAVDSNSRESLVVWAKPLLDAKLVKDMVDPRLGDKYDLTEMKHAMTTASMCIHHMSSKRPYMNQVLQLLKGEEVPIELNQSPTTPRSLLLEYSCDLEDYTRSNYLNDLNGHRQLLME